MGQNKPSPATAATLSALPLLTRILQLPRSSHALELPSPTPLHTLALRVRPPSPSSSLLRSPTSLHSLQAAPSPLSLIPTRPPRRPLPTQNPSRSPAALTMPSHRLPPISTRPWTKPILAPQDLSAPLRHLAPPKVLSEVLTSPLPSKMTFASSFVSLFGGDHREFGRDSC